MKIAVVGAGAIGGFLGARLSLAGEEVTFIARGANLAAIQQDGLRLIEEDGSERRTTTARAYEKTTDAGPHDAVFLTVKAHQVSAVAPSLEALCHAETSIVTMQNGIPWWYFHDLSGPYRGRPVKNADPDGIVGRSIDPRRIIGSVVYPAAHLVAPGVIQVVEGNRFSLGELDGSTTPRLKALTHSLGEAGFKVRTAHDIRSEIWLKLWGNLSFNPISALTHATLVDICQFPLTRDLARAMMTEAEAIANKLGVTFPLPIERRIAGAEKVGAHKTSMLQDIEQGRAIELDALVGSIVELGALTDTPTPHINAVYACASLLAKTVNPPHGRLTITSS